MWPPSTWRPTPCSSAATRCTWPARPIANTLTTLPEIEWVNFLVVDRPVGLDIANTLPMGAFSATTAQDIGAAYEQLLSRRVDSGSDASLKPLTSNVTLYFPSAAWMA